MPLSSMKFLTLFIFLIAASSVAASDVVITKVYYDPLEESGSEAIEIQNTGISAININGWIVATETSATDATLPDDMLQPNQKYLIADAGWSEKRDNLHWRLADHEEAITLKNADAGVALKQNNTIVDAVGWGDPSEIDPEFQSNVAQPVAEGEMLIRSGNSFSAQLAEFFSTAVSIPIIAIILESSTISSVEITDDSQEDGTQIVLQPNTNKVVTITVNSTMDELQASGFDQTIQLEKSGTQFSGEFLLPHTQPPGEYEIDIADHAEKVEVLSLLSFQVEEQSLYFEGKADEESSSAITLTNTGNVPATLTLQPSSLTNGDVSLEPTFLFYHNNAEITSLLLAVDQSQTIDVVWQIPDEDAGQYEGSLHVSES